ncbi:hypothetical protein HWV62_15737 [Athelia sp. TMB]|nr:hypothetical protein HWV62_15737 [Athelia sp. TMB]
MSLGFCVTTAVWAVAPVAQCQTLEYIICSFYEVSLPATSLLFFFRVKAVYGNARFVTLFFGILWFSVLGLSILLMLAVQSDHIPHTLRCKEAVVRAYGSIPTIISAIYDTLVFMAISYRVVQHTLIGETWAARWRSFVTGEGLYTLSRALLRGGQLYYFATIGISMVNTVLTMATSFPDELRLLFGPPTVALPSAMACFVFRAVLLGAIDDDALALEGGVPQTTIRFGRASEYGTGRGTRNDISLRDLGGPSRLPSVFKPGMSRGDTDETDYDMEMEGKGRMADGDAASQV